MVYQEHDSVFHSQGIAYNLNKVFAITAYHRVQEVPLRILEAELFLNTLNLGEIDFKRVANADLKYPIILSVYNGSTVIVDGMHRFIKASMTEDNTMIPVVWISPEELETTKI